MPFFRWERTGVQMWKSLGPAPRRDSCSSRHGGLPPATGAWPVIAQQHVWSWVAHYFEVPDFVAVLQCSPRLLDDVEKEGLWRHFALVNNHVQMLPPAGLEWAYPFSPEISLERIVRWQTVVQMNFKKGHRSSASVRIRDVCLKVPMRGEENAYTLLCSIRKMLHCSASSGGRSSSSSKASSDRQGSAVAGSSLDDAGGQHEALLAAEEAPRCHGRAMRLRRVQWGGRPGLELPPDELMMGDGHQLLLEFALPGSHGWPLPPKLHGCPTQPALLGAEERALSPPRVWPFNGRFLGQPLLANHDGMPGVMPIGSSSAPAHPEARTGRCATPLLIRVKSLVLPSETWLSVDGSAPLTALYQELERVLRKESALLANIDRPLKLQLMSLENPRLVTRCPSQTSIRQQMWAQCETIRVELEDRMLRILRLSSSSQVRGADLRGDILDSPSYTGCSRPSTLAPNSADGQPSPLLAYVFREPAFRQGAAEGADFPFAPQAELRRHGVRTSLRSRTQCSWTRQSSEPVAASALPLVSRQVSEPSHPNLRQVSEACDELCEDFMFSDDEDAERVLDFEAGSRAERWGGVQRGSVDVSPRRPPALPGQELPAALGTATLESQAEASGGDLAEAAVEQIAPHFPPVLLHSSLRVRQFEFHPSLPSVLLIGDREGSLTAVDTESSVMHPPLSLGTCPLLALSWMKHNPQHAVCGASHTGKIELLRYNPNAHASEPSLSSSACVEDFPMLSSLSLNCTDDFLVASGISPNIAIYDVQAGKVLQRAYGAHDNCINISRFCNTSPHVFATASFDHTCRVWDLRQPLAQARAVKTLHTGGRNVMCIFSPDDKYLLCSGVDTRMKQFEVPAWAETPESFPLREPMHEERYRRSTYLASSRFIVTGATEESHLHVMSTHGDNLGVVNFRGVLTSSMHPQDLRRDGSLARQHSGLAFRLENWRRAPFFPTGTHSAVPAVFRRLGSPTSRHDRRSSPGLVTGHLLQRELESGGAAVGSAPHEFIQSIRAHPTHKNRVGVLLSLMNGERSHVATVDLDPQRFG